MYLRAAVITETLDTAITCLGLNRLDIIAVRPEQHDIAILFHNGLLFPCLSAGSSLAFGLQPPKHYAARICAALTEIGIEGPETSDPATLSGGQETRVALMRTNRGDQLDPAHRDFPWPKDQGCCQPRVWN